MTTDNFVILSPAARTPYPRLVRPGLTLSILFVSLAFACGPDTAETAGATTTATDDPVDTDPPTTTGEPYECGDMDPATVAEFRIVFDAWPDLVLNEHEFDRTCTIDSVDVEAGMVITRITCDVDGTPRTATIETSSAPEGPPDWQAGQSVALHSRDFSDEYGNDSVLQLTLSDDPMALLIDGRRWSDNNSSDTTLQIGPIRRELLTTCYPGEDDFNQLRYSLESGVKLDLYSGFRGSLAIDSEHAYAIDLVGSGVWLYHDREHSLIRRVRTE